MDVRLTGDFDAVHTEGDNSPVLPTDTIGSTVYALAQEHLTGSIEAFGLALTERFVAASPAAAVAEVLLRTHGSAFSGFLRDEFTVLAETDDRIMASDVSAEWTYHGDRRPSYDDLRATARAALVDVFSNHESASVQHTLFAMGEAVIDACPEVDAVRLRMPNKHHIPVDLSAIGLTNDRAVFVATDRPFGVIEGEVRRT